MFQVNDVLIYGTQGVCQIAGIEEKSISGVKKRYYVLKPVNDPVATIYAPVDNEQVLKKMRRLLTRDQIDQLIDSMPKENTVWIANDNDRKELYRQILTGGDHLELIKMLKSIHSHRLAREAEGKRLHMIDAHFFKDAEQILYDEFQYVLKLSSKEALMQYIISRLEK